LHRNPAGAIGGERNHKAAKRIHSLSRARSGQAMFDTGTAFLFNPKQLDRRIAATRDTKFCKWLQHLGAESGDDAEEEPLDEKEDAAGGSTEEFDRLEISGGIDSIVDEDIVDGQVVDEGSIFD
jgi:hypothetical protein